MSLRRRIAARWLASAGLELKPEQTRIGHTLTPSEGRAGFDCLGFEVRQYPVGYHRAGKPRLGYKTHIKPSRASRQRHYAALAETVRRQRAATQRQLIGALNPPIRGWAACYAGAIAQAAFNAPDHRLFRRPFRWGRRRHPKKSTAWVVRRYRRTRGANRCVFGVPDGARLATHASVPIRRHVMVRRDASPYDGNWRYWASRLGRHPELPTSKAVLLKRQRGRCAWCGRYFTELGDPLESDHRTPRRESGRGPNARLASDGVLMTRADHRGAV
jgi:RNA-directed DNA polymerase